MGAEIMDRDELIEFLRENMTIQIDRNLEYYSYPSLEVVISIAGQEISRSSTTIYDGERG